MVHGGKSITIGSCLHVISDKDIDMWIRTDGHANLGNDNIVVKDMPLSIWKCSLFYNT